MGAVRIYAPDTTRGDPSDQLIPLGGVRYGGFGQPQSRGALCGLGTSFGAYSADRLGITYDVSNRYEALVLKTPQGLLTQGKASLKLGIELATTSVLFRVGWSFGR